LRNGLLLLLVMVVALVVLLVVLLVVQGFSATSGEANQPPGILATAARSPMAWCDAPGFVGK
jgi:hypothetical protein